ncbi:MAG: hypothetical protein U9N76_04440, partial [Candidatus Marinimicrobia bacterium]|nr:hypothetical protein [Candidatus Neomarinimicrobiota bacterium]
MKNKIIIILLLLFSINIIFADILETNKSLCDTCEKKIYLNFESTSFIKNNEYFHHFTKGYTGIGFFIKPTIEYYLTKNTKANLGIYLLKYSGVDNFTQSIPIFTIQHKLTKNTDLIFGNIYGTLNHKLEEPLFRFDTYYQNNIEYGLQLLHNSKYLQSDIWMNWDKFIFNNS